jgi:hypothetical protein
MTFLQYLRNINYFLLLLLEIGDTRLNPYVLYFSPYRGESLENLKTSLTKNNYSQLFSNYNRISSKFTASLTTMATFYFANKMRNFEAASSKIPFDVRFIEDESVKEVQKYFDKFGYTWSMKCIEPVSNSY